MPMISQVFLQAFALLAMTALISCAHLQERQENSSPGQTCQMRVVPDVRGNDAQYDSGLPANNLEECEDKCLTDYKCLSTEHRGGTLCLFSTKTVEATASPDNRVAFKQCSDLSSTTSTTTTPTPTSTKSTATTTTTMAPTTTTTAVSGDSVGSCPTGWSQFGGSCYAAGLNKQTWFDAKTACETIGASLAVIDSEEENAYLKEIAKDYIRVGEGCVMLLKTDGFRWHDISCVRKQFYICELQLRKAF